MHRWGHVGAALFLYAPAGAVLTGGGEPSLAALGAAVAVAMATLPDADEPLPMAHRGYTHTIWFVAVLAALAAVAGTVLEWYLAAGPLLAITVGGATAISLLSHLLADSITPMGIRPFYPVSTWHHSFDFTPAANPRANTTMLGAGVLFSLLCQGLVLL